MADGRSIRASILADSRSRGHLSLPDA
jgi:hypothetical protein